MQPFPLGESEEDNLKRFQHVTEMTILTVQLIVEFSKRVPGFDTLLREDQITLLKVGYAIHVDSARLLQASPSPPRTFLRLCAEMYSHLTRKTLRSPFPTRVRPFEEEGLVAVLWARHSLPSAGRRRRTTTFLAASGANCLLFLHFPFLQLPSAPISSWCLVV